MTTMTAFRPTLTPTPTLRPTPSSVAARERPAAGPIKNNRSSYLSWGAAYIVGWGSYALSAGSDPVLHLPSMVPTLLLGAGLLGATTVTSIAVAKASKGITGPAAMQGKMFGAAWAIGFIALFLLITAVAGDLGTHRVETLLWPAGSGLVVGLLYLMGGALDRDGLQYALGVWLALVTTAAVFLGTPGMYVVLALGAGGAYVTAAVLEPRRVAAAVRAASTQPTP